MHKQQANNYNNYSTLKKNPNQPTKPKKKEKKTIWQLADVEYKLPSHIICRLLLEVIRNVYFIQ